MVLAGSGSASRCGGARARPLREITRGLVDRTPATEFGGWFVVVMCLLGAAGLLALLLDVGPNWAPAVVLPGAEHLGAGFLNCRNPVYADIRLGCAQSRMSNVSDMSRLSRPSVPCRC